MDRFTNQFLNVAVWSQYWSNLLQAFELTVLLAVLITVSGLLLGFILGLIRVAAPAPVRWVVIVFADVFRALPPLMILVTIYFALPFAGVQLSGFSSAWIGLSLVLAAFVEEAIYGCLVAVGKGQWEAARATGFGLGMSLLVIIFPQAVRMAIAPLTNRTVAVVKNTALGSVIAVPEILNVAMSALSDAANSTPLTMAALLYLVLFAPFVVLSRWLETRFPQRR